jgi:endoglucanase
MTGRGSWRRVLVLAGILAAAPGIGPAGTSPPTIRVNQLGYRPADPKIAIVAGRISGSFSVKRLPGGEVAFEGEAGGSSPRDPASGDQVSLLDFSSVRADGQYVVTTPQGLSSPPFRIGDGVYDQAFRDALRSFKYQRCGVAIADGSPFGHPACHLDDAREWGPSAPRRAATGGWHDAGDYGKYVVPAGITLWHLGAIVSLQPSSDGARELLDEMRWELDWLLKMQREDGSVHHKVGPSRWTGNRAPQDDREPRFVYPVSSAATADFAAALAMAARLYERADPSYAGRLREAAEVSARWLDRHPAIVPTGGFKDPPGDDGGSGTYDDDDDRDERLWASAELWRTSRSPRYAIAIPETLRRWTPFDYPASWQRVQNLAFLTLADPQGPLDPAARARLLSLLDGQAAAITRGPATSGYRVALGPGDYYWGSNGLVLENAVVLLTASLASGKSSYRHAALDQLHYVLGRNALGKSFVTGFGSDPPLRPYHQPSMMHPRRPVPPGLLVGGPNASGAGVPHDFPARAYRDQDSLYGVNEPAIYWTAALAHVLALLQAAR